MVFLTGIDHVKESVLVAPYNQLSEVQSILEDNADDVAAVIVEPLHRCTKPLVNVISLFHVTSLC